MKRYFDDHYVREVISLDGGWKFLCDKENIGESQKYTLGLPHGKTVIVPSVWNNQLDLYTYFGTCWYEKDFYFEGTAKLVFEGVMTECTVWLDGRYIGYHYGGFCQFDYIVENLAAGIHKLVLKVNNSFDENSLPQQEVDWFRYGGITRSVSVEKVQGLFINYAKIDYNLSDDLKSADIFFEIELFGADKKKENDFNIYLGSNKIYSQKISLKKGTYHTVLTDKIHIDNIKLWTPGNPNLYTVTFSTDNDDLIDRIGFRSVKIKDLKLYINNTQTELRGVNRHEDYPGLGMAITTAVMERDLDIIENLGCNTIRGSHYPNSRIFLDILDERGILFWSEIPIWGCGFSESALGNKVVVQRGLNMHKEMVKHYYNHPSIIFWGMHNEILTATTAAKEMSKLYYTYLKKYANNRLVTYATCRHMTDECFEYCDVIGINAYHGWFGSKIEGWYSFPEKFGERKALLGFKDKPVIMSEFGGGAISGHHTFKNVAWTEEYQANLHTTALSVFRECPYIIGYCVWQFCDTASDMHISRINAKNNKGIVDEHRNPKAAFFAVKEKYHQFKEENKKGGIL